jgi:hypothetical protein
MNQPNRLALVLTGLSTFLLGAGSYWLAFDRPVGPPTKPTGAMADGRRPRPEEPPAKPGLRPEKRKPKSDVAKKRRHKRKSKQTGTHRRRKQPKRVRSAKVKKTPAAG